MVNPGLSPSQAADDRRELPPPTELTVGASWFLQVGTARWWVRSVRFYADPLTSRFRAAALLERRRDADADPMHTRPSSTVELVGEGRTLGAAALALLVQLVPACEALHDDRRRS